MSDAEEMTQRLKNVRLNTAISESDSYDGRQEKMVPADLRNENMATVKGNGTPANVSAFQTVIPSESMSGEDNAGKNDSIVDLSFERQLNNLTKLRLIINYP